jgi:hypothetical protein
MSLLSLTFFFFFFSSSLFFLFFFQGDHAAALRCSWTHDPGVGVGVSVFAAQKRFQVCAQFAESFSRFQHDAQNPHCAVHHFVVLGCGSLSRDEVGMRLSLFLPKLINLLFVVQISRV